MWTALSYASWGISIVLALWMLYDWSQIVTTFADEDLTTAREGELEAVSDNHRI
jgi:hypothetical protein